MPKNQSNSLEGFSKIINEMAEANRIKDQEEVDLARKNMGYEKDVIRAMANGPLVNYFAEMRRSHSNPQMTVILSELFEFAKEEIKARLGK